MINLKIDKNEPGKFILRIFYIGILNESPTHQSLNCFYSSREGDNILSFKIGCNRILFYSLIGTLTIFGPCWIL